MNPLDKPITLTLTLQQVSRLRSLLKHHIDDLRGEYEIIPEDAYHITADIALAEDTLDALQEAMKQ
jgi:hypothetical protein